MSKLKDYMDSKSKARHRMRRYETDHKKAVRRNKIRNHEYGGFYESRGWCGYYLWGGECFIDYEGKVCGNRWYDDDRCS